MRLPGYPFLLPFTSLSIRPLRPALLPLLFLAAFLCCSDHLTVNADFQFASARVSSGLVALYTFTEGASNPTSLQTADQSGVNVLGNITLSSDPLSASWTTGRAGIHLSGTGSQTRAVSAFNVTTLVSLLSATAGFTIEMWFTSSSTTQKGMILGYGNWTTKAHESGSCGDFDLALFQVGSNIATNVIQNRSAALCSPMTLPVTLTSPTYVALTLNSSWQRLAVNTAAPITAVMTKLNFHTWLLNVALMLGQPLYNTGSGYTTNTWAGDIFLVSVYNRSLTPSELRQNYIAGIPFSIPTPLPAASWLAVEENALPQDLSSLSPSPLFLNYSNTDFSTYSAVTIAITSPPTYGLLLTSDLTTQIGGSGGVSLPYIFSVGQDFAYQPPSVFSGVDSFTFAASNSISAGPSGVVNILVIAPPTSTDVAASVVVSTQGEALSHMPITYAHSFCSCSDLCAVLSVCCCLLQSSSPSPAPTPTPSRAVMHSASSSPHCLPVASCIKLPTALRSALPSSQYPQLSQAQSSPSSTSALRVPPRRREVWMCFTRTPSSFRRR